jgi:hypothetical protein
MSPFNGQVRWIIVFVLTFCLATEPTLSEAQTVPPPLESQHAGAEASAVQARNLDDVRAFFGSTRTRAALDSLKIDHQQVDKTVATLSSEGLARAAELTRQVQKGSLVSPLELRAAIATAAQRQSKNLADVRAFFASDHVRTALKSTKVDYERIDKAVATLSPDDLALVAARTNQIREDFAAGQSNAGLNWLLATSRRKNPSRIL